MLTTVILVFSGLVLLLLLALIIYSDFKAATNRWLAVIIIASFLWLLSNLAANLSSSDAMNLFFSRGAMLGAAITPYAFLGFCISLVQRHLGRKLAIILAIPTAILLILTPTKYNVESVSGGGASIHPGLAYTFLIITFVIYFLSGIVLLLRDYFFVKGERRQQILFVLIGTIFTIVPAVLLSVILPQFGNSDSISFAPAIVLVFVTFTTIAIVKHKLLDVKAFVFRALIYFVTTILLATAYVAPVIWALLKIFDLEFVWGQFILATLIGTLAATYYHSLRQSFNRLTANIFFRDSYNPTELLSSLNKNLASIIELNTLIRTSANIIEKYIKPDFCVFALPTYGSERLRLIGKISNASTPFDVDSFAKVIKLNKREVIITSQLIDQSDDELKAMLKANDIAAVAKLTNNQSRPKETLGYMLIGTRKSGKDFDFEDRQVFETIARALVIAIQNSLHFEEIQQFNVTLQGRVDEATRKLKSTNEKLKKMDETKDEFISMASHQLRTPLTSVKGYVSMVLDGDVGPINHQQRELLNQSFQSSQRMANLISDLLNLSRINTGKFVIEESPVYLPAIIETELQQLREMAQAKKIELKLTMPPTFPTLMLDDGKMHQAIMNLVDNALYYTPEGGKVDVQLIETPGTIEFRVVDNGIGVPREAQKHLFGKMFRAENARRARPDGTGLGLFMVKKVVAEQQGAIIFETEENKGSTFGFRFNKKDHLVPDATTPVPAQLPA